LDFKVGVGDVFEAMKAADNVVLAGDLGGNVGKDAAVTMIHPAGADSVINSGAHVQAVELGFGHFALRVTAEMAVSGSHVQPAFRLGEAADNFTARLEERIQTIGDLGGVGFTKLLGNHRVRPAGSEVAEQQPYFQGSPEENGGPEIARAEGESRDGEERLEMIKREGCSGGDGVDE